ncbi:Protein Wnt-16 [Manis pentadactyla]|nr:Protein Wnt-16 [Manis pentadactyla]
MIQPTLPLSNVKSGELAFVMSLSSFSALAALQHLLLEVLRLKTKNLVTNMKMTGHLDWVELHSLGNRGDEGGYNRIKIVTRKEKAGKQPGNRTNTIIVTPPPTLCRISKLIGFPGIAASRCN